MNVENIQGIFELRSKVEHLFFKDFMQVYEKPKGLNPTHIITMMFLSHKGKLPMSKMSYHMGLEKGSFTTVANRLVSDGYIVKERNSEDKRVYELTLTQKGLDFTGKFKKLHVAYIQEKLNELEEEEEFFKLVKSFNKLLNKMIDC